MNGIGIIDAFLSPLGFGLLLALFLWLLRKRLPRGIRRAGIAVEIVCLLLATPLGANALVTLQERRVAQPEACAAPQPSVVVLLSGGLRREPRDALDIGALNAASLQRTLAAAELVKRISATELVVSGTRSDYAVAQSTLMVELARQLGVPADKMRAETASLTTWDNAQRVRALDPALPSRVWLVTSALHMPRALIAFRAAGFEACAYPGDFLAASFDGAADFLPSGSAVANSAAVLHEWVGEIVYRLRAARQ
jgi:uncharacterized SAM-binding protein YcdF (DUF218 family)